MAAIQWFVDVQRIFRVMREKAHDALTAIQRGEKPVAAKISGYLKKDLELLARLWEEEKLKERDFNDMWRHIGFGEKHDF